MHAYFTSFITTGDPNTVDGKYANRPHWETYEKSAPKLMLFGDGNDERAGGDRLGIAAELRNDTWSSKECQFWSERTILCES
jgi:triacylglycerol lipase